MQSANVKAFLAAVHTGSFSRAAEVLFITQPTLTHRIQSLERELNAQLFDRRKGQRVAELTDMGKMFLPLATRWDFLLDETGRLGKVDVAPVFSVGATQTLSNYVMPEVYARFMLRGMPAELALHTLHFSECYSQVERCVHVKGDGVAECLDISDMLGKNGTSVQKRSTVSLTHESGRARQKRLHLHALEL